MLILFLLAVVVVDKFVDRADNVGFVEYVHGGDYVR